MIPRVVYGASLSLLSWFAFAANLTGAPITSSYVRLPAIPSTSNPYASSADGSIVSFNVQYHGAPGSPPTSADTIIWRTADSGITNLGSPGFVLFSFTSTGSYGTGHSRDPGSSIGPALWSQSGGVTSLAVPAGGIGGAYGFGVSPLGTVVGAGLFPFFSSRPVIWQSPSSPIELPLPPGWKACGAAIRISDDGTLIFGTGSFASDENGAALLREEQFEDEGVWTAVGIVRWKNMIPEKWISFPLRPVAAKDTQEYLRGLTVEKLGISSDGEVCAGTYAESILFGGIDFEHGFVQIGSARPRFLKNFLIDAVDPSGKLMVGRSSYFGRNADVPAELAYNLVEDGRNRFMNRVGGTRPVAELAFATGLPPPPTYVDYDEISDAHVISLGLQSDGSCKIVERPSGFSAAVLTTPNPLPPEPAAITNAGTLFVPAKGVQPKVSYSETHDEKPSSTTVIYTVPAKLSSGTWHATFVGALSQSTLANTGAETIVAFTLGHFTFSKTLGDDPSWKPGKKAAAWKEYINVDGKAKIQLAVNATWTARSISIIAKCNDASGNPIAWPDEVGWAGPIEQTINATLQFGDDFGEILVPSNGAASRHFFTPFPKKYGLIFPLRLDRIVLSGHAKG